MRPGLVFLVPEQTTPSGGATYNAAVVDALRSAGVDVALQPVGGDWPEADDAARTALERALGAVPRGDVAVLDGLIGSACAPQVAAAVAAGRRVALLVHLPLPAETGLDPARAERLAAAERDAVAAASVVLATSRWAADDVRRRYGVTAVPVLPGATPRPLARGSEPPHLLMLGSLTPRKNHAPVVRALGGLADLPWTLSVVGADGPASAAVDEAIAAAGLGDRVTRAGALTGEALEAVWDRTDLLLLPSLAETFGLVVTEALAHGVPALVAAGTGAEEALAGDAAPLVQAGSAGGAPTDGAAPGVLVGAARTASAEPPAPLPGAVLDPRDAAAWADCVRDWITDPDVRSRWSARARARRETLRPWSATAADLLAALDPPPH